MAVCVGEHRGVGSKGRAWRQVGWREAGRERSGVNHCVPASTDGQREEAPSFFSVF